MEVTRVFSFVFILLTGYTTYGNGREFTPPRIVVPDTLDHVIGSGDNFTLRCEGKTPITWSYPNNTEYTDYVDVGVFSTMTIQSSTTPDSAYLFGAILSIRNASYVDTGYYYCHEKGTVDYDDLYRVSKVYLYVRDPEQLSILSEMPFGMQAYQHSEVILPCRPTSPDVHVELYQATGEEVENVSYDPKVGFTINTGTALGHIITTCSFTKGNKTFDLDILLSVSPITYSIAKPYIEDLSGGHTVAGDKLILRCTLKVSVHFVMEWVTPSRNQSGQVHITKSTRKSHDVYYQNLTIEHTTLEDQGEYTCVVKDNNHSNNNTKFIRIFDKDEHFINLTEENALYSLSANAGEPSVQWRIDVRAHPLPKLTWYNNENKEIVSGWSDSKTQKYEVHLDSSSGAFLKIYDITIHDRGFYRLEAENEFEKKPLTLFLNVTDKPTVDIQMADFHLINEESTVKCVVAAYPDPSIYWFYKNCQDNSCDFVPQRPYKVQPEGLQVISYLNITSIKSGIIACVANNSLGSDESARGFFVSDVRNGFGIWSTDDEVMEKHHGTKQLPVAVGEAVTLYCAASQLNYTNLIQWYRSNGSNLKLIQDDGIHYTTERSNTEFSNKLTLNMYDLNYTDSGEYVCQVKDRLNDIRNTSIALTVRDPEKPIITDTNLNDSQYTVKFNEKFELWCYAKGMPTPSITWYKGGVEQIEGVVGDTAIFEDNNQRMIILNAKVEDETSFECKAENKVGATYGKLSLVIADKPEPNKILIVVLVTLFVIFFVAITCLLVRYRKERNLRLELKRAGLANFENGALESLNPELGIDDQAELLPYDKRCEFPREKLKLGKQLGSGAFGVVMKAEASGIVDGEDTTVVAVKMVKRNADTTYIRALASELKIMVHLGKHLNVVNLLGACTKNVVKRELLVIVEYCRYGNLHNYLLRHRDSFINQVDAKTGKIDYTFGSEILERSFSVSSNTSGGNSPLPREMADYRGNMNYTGETTYTGTTAVSMTPTGAEDYLISSNNSAQPEWRSNYRGDYKGTVKPISTKDLITWTFQVARGMEYLASRKVLHGDLAARNILLADNNVVKICDFGLAKNMYKSDNYKKQGDGPLPVKWMAIESIRDRVFSTQSDVWSYGIVLWEFFSLARTPYPGMEADERLYNKLVDGYRMEAPEFSTKEIYGMMCDCWHPKPLSRPSFTKLAQTIGLMLEESVRQHYVDLNDPYLVMNTQRLENGQSDYLAMVSPPDFEHLSSPHNYVNGEIQPDLSPNPMDTPGYLCMKSSHIFSPRQNEDSIFTFDVDGNKKHKNSNGEIAVGTELLPMLHTQNESDCETPNITTTPTSFSNPSYHVPPSITEKSDEDIVKTADNYVNIPQSKSAMKSETSLNCNSNPSTNTKSNNYVNSCSRDWDRLHS